MDDYWLIAVFIFIAIGGGYFFKSKSKE